MTPSGQKIQVLYSHASSFDQVKNEAMSFCFETKEEIDDYIKRYINIFEIKPKIYKITIEEL